MSRIRLLDDSKSAVYWTNVNDVTTFSHGVMNKIFWCYFVPLVKFSCCSKFNVNIITSSGVMTISFCKGLSRNPEIGNILVRVLPNIWRLD